MAITRSTSPSNFSITQNQPPKPKPKSPLENRQASEPRSAEPPDIIHNIFPDNETLKKDFKAKIKFLFIHNDELNKLTIQLSNAKDLTSDHTENIVKEFFNEHHDDLNKEHLNEILVFFTTYHNNNNPSRDCREID